MYSKISLEKNRDDSYSICLYYYSNADTEFGMDFLTSEKFKNNVNNVKTYLTKHAKNITVKGVKILVNGAVIATMSFSSFMNIYGATPKYSMAYLYSGTTSQQISYINRTNGALNTVSPTYFDINIDGTLKFNTVSTDLVNHAHSQGMKVVPFLSNHWNAESGINALLNRENLSTEIANMIEQYNLDGVNVDIEAVNHNYQSEFTDFVAKLRSKIPANKEVSVAVAANPNGWTTGWHGLYDYTGIAQHADYLMVMAYDESWQGSTPGPVASGNFVERSITYALSKTTPDKIVIGMPFYGRLWSADNNFNGNGIKLDLVDDFITTFGGTSVYDTATQSVRGTFTVTSSSPVRTLNGKTLIPGTYTVWYENADSIQYKLSLINKYNLKGSGAWALGQEPSSIWQNFSTWLNTSGTTEEIITTRTGRVNATTLNVRSGPGTNYSKIATLNNNDTVYIIDLINGWYKIRIGTNSVGYVSSQYIIETTVVTPPPTTTPEAPPITETTPPPVTTEPEPEPTPVITTQTGVVTATVLNVRSSPTTKSNVISSLRKNSSITILETASGWHKMQLSNGQIGYVSSAYVTTNPVTTATTTRGVVNTSALNVRSGPSTNTRVISLIRKGTTVDILSTSNGWHTVRLSNGQIGYVSSSYITNQSTSTVAPTNTQVNTPPATTSSGTVNTNVLNVRSGPSTRTRVLTTLRRGSSVNIISTNNGWHTIRLANGQTGYVSSTYISNPGSYTATTTSRTGIVNTAVLNVRSGPATNKRVISTLRRGTSVNILSTSNGWHTIRLANGQIGYVSAPLVR